MATTEERLTTLESQFAAFKANSEAAGQSATTAANAAKDTADAAAEALNTIKGVTTDTFAKDVEVVHKSGEETITSEKTFTKPLILTESSRKILARYSDLTRGTLPTDTFYYELYRAQAKGKDNPNIFEDMASISGYVGPTGECSFTISVDDFQNDTAGKYRGLTIMIPSTGIEDTYSMIPNTCPWWTSPYNDNLGKPSSMWAQLYAKTSSINTSDQNAKQNITDYPDALLDAWEDVDFQLFKFKDAVAKKGTEARIHAGLIAQAIKSAFEAHNIDPTEYGLFCYDSWDAEPEVREQDGNVIQEAKAAGESYGLRYIECLCVEAACQRRKNVRLEARIAALEAKIS